MTSGLMSFRGIQSYSESVLLFKTMGSAVGVM